MLLFVSSSLFLQPTRVSIAIENAITSGVKVVATIHASSILDLKSKKAFQNVIDKKLFERYVVLGFSNGVGTIEGVYNEVFRCIYV